MAKKTSISKQVSKTLVVVICTAGFLLQTSEFLFLYWTYPTVVDIQVSIPTEIEVPGITLCSANGIIPETICKLGGDCTREKMFVFINPCGVFPSFCVNGKPPPGFTAVRYGKFMMGHELNFTDLQQLRVPLEEIFTCKITGGGRERDCDTENVVLGSYYSDTGSPNFCFSLNTQWGDPTRKIQRIKKSEKIQLHFYMDISHRNKSADPGVVQLPKYNPISSSSLQLAIHSQKLSASPFVSGKGFLGGKNYRIKLTKDEKHLLPPPYQTNCTDYLKDWKARGGKGPLNQVMVLQECRKNASLEKMGCVPYSIDYPHNETLCRNCMENCTHINRVGENCTDLLQHYNQPCDSTSYHMNVEEKLINILQTYTSQFMVSKESMIIRQKGYNCTSEKMFTKQCQMLNIDMDFDDYEVTNLTYNPKFENLELFSVIGGYMGMYLGISLVAVYDFLETALSLAYRLLKKRRTNKIKQVRRKFQKTSKNKIDTHYSTEFRKRSASSWERDFH